MFTYYNVTARSYNYRAEQFVVCMCEDQWLMKELDQAAEIWLEVPIMEWSLKCGDVQLHWPPPSLLLLAFVMIIMMHDAKSPSSY